MRQTMHQTTSLWFMALAYLPFALMLAVWGAYPTVTGSTIPILDTMIAMVVLVAGLGMTILWGGFASRALKLQRYWLLVAREIEGQMPAMGDYLRRSMALDSGEAVIVNNERVRLDSLERPKAFGPFHLYYGVFGLIFLLLLIVNFMRLGRAM